MQRQKSLLKKRPEIDRWICLYLNSSDQGSDRSLRKIRTDQGRPGYSEISLSKICPNWYVRVIPEMILRGG